MAFIVGYVTKEERAELERRGWEVEDASRYNLSGEGGEHLLGIPGPEHEAICIFVDTSLFDVMNEPDWEKGP